MPKNLRINNKQFVDETRKLSFVFNGKKLYGYKGDSLASALLSNDILDVSSIKLLLLTLKF